MYGKPTFLCSHWGWSLPGWSLPGWSLPGWSLPGGVTAGVVTAGVVTAGVVTAGGGHCRGGHCRGWSLPERVTAGVVTAGMVTAGVVTAGGGGVTAGVVTAGVVTARVVTAGVVTARVLVVFCGFLCPELRRLTLTWFSNLQVIHSPQCWEPGFNSKYTMPGSIGYRTHATACQVDVLTISLRVPLLHCCKFTYLILFVPTGM